MGNWLLQGKHLKLHGGIRKCFFVVCGLLWTPASRFPIQANTASQAHFPRLLGVPKVEQKEPRSLGRERCWRQHLSEFACNAHSIVGALARRTSMHGCLSQRGVSSNLWLCAAEGNSGEGPLRSWEAGLSEWRIVSLFGFK